MITYLKKIIIVIGIVMIVAISGWLAFSGGINQNIFPEQIGSHQEDIQKEVVLIIDDGQGLPQTFEDNFREGMTALDLLSEKTKEKNIFLKTKIYDQGVFIEAIGDKENGDSGKYWLYYVNGEMPQVAADKKEIKVGDKVEFKFEKSPF